MPYPFRLEIHRHASRRVLLTALVAMACVGANEAFAQSGAAGPGSVESDFCPEIPPLLDTASYPSFEAAVEAACESSVTLYVSDVSIATRSIVVPPTLTLWFLGRGEVRAREGITVTVKGGLLAPQKQIFQGKGTVQIGEGQLHEVQAAWWGVRADGSTDNADAIERLLDALPAGTTVLWPKGEIRLGRTIVVEGPPGLTWRGAGARFLQPDSRAATRLVYSGLGTLPAIEIRTSASRGMRLENLGVHYSRQDFIDVLIRLQDVAGFSAQHCSFGGDRISAASDIVNASAIIEFRQVEHAVFDHCSFSDASRGLYVPSSVARMLDGLVLRDCHFGDFRDVAVEYQSSGSEGLSIRGCRFRPVREMANHLLDIRVDGFEIDGNTFGADDSLRMPQDFVVQLEGRGRFGGNRIVSPRDGVLIDGGEVQFAGNDVSALLPLKISGGIVTGGANHYYVDNGNAGVSIGDTGQDGIAVRIGPDTFQGVGGSDSFPGSSYRIEEDDDLVTGLIHYAGIRDASNGGPLLQSENVRIIPVDAPYQVRTNDTQLLARETGLTFTNRNSPRAVSFTLPPAVAGLEFTFVKLANQLVTVEGDSEDMILLAESAPVSALTHGSNEVGARLKVRAISDTEWLVEEMRGSW